MTLNLKFLIPSVFLFFQELIERIIKLEKHTTQLRNVIKKQSPSSESPSNAHKKFKNRIFDFQKSKKRHILLRFYYLGWDYQGFATQEDNIETIEHHIFHALTTTCLIESRETSNYHRCGRTDKGVSAFHQVISLDIRSSLTESEIEENSNLEKEIPYCSILNRVLPPNIRCVTWMPLRNPEYSARFDCKQRTYRYFFPKSDLDLNLMQQGANYLLGCHDFRNLCKMDINNGVTAFERNISSIQICAVDKESEGDLQMFFIELTGKAFLWHQIRCIVAILFLVGQKLEKPEIVRDLLDIEKHPSKPNYQMASYVPLNLYHCDFREKSENVVSDQVRDLTEWVYEEFNLKMVIECLQGQWTLESVK